MANTLTARENELIVMGMKCAESQPKIDMAKLATMAGLKNAASASVMYNSAKRKLMKAYDNTGNSSTLSTPNGTPTKASNANGKAAAGKGAASAPRKRKAAAADDEASPGAGNLADVDATPAQARKESKALSEAKGEVKDEDMAEEDATAAEEQAEVNEQLVGSAKTVSVGSTRRNSTAEEVADQEAPPASKSDAFVLDKSSTEATAATTGKKKRGRPAVKKEAPAKEVAVNKGDPAKVEAIEKEEAKKTEPVTKPATTKKGPKSSSKATVAKNATTPKSPSKTVTAKSITPKSPAKATTTKKASAPIPSSPKPSSSVKTQAPKKGRAIIKPKSTSKTPAPKTPSADEQTGAASDADDVEDKKSIDSWDVERAVEEAYAAASDSEEI